MAPSGFDTAVRSGSGLNYLRLSIRSILVGKSGLSGSVENMLCFLGEVNCGMFCQAKGILRE